MRFFPNLILIAFLFAIFQPLSAQEDIDITDGVKHSVPLEDIIFDDFDIPSRFRRLSDATPDDIERLRDRITPLCHGEIAACRPINYEAIADGDAWLRGDDQVIGYVAEDEQAYAYPFKILNFHEIVNDTLADVPVLISYCPLCNSAVVYSRMLNEELLVFGNTSALYNSDMVMYDLQTDSFWVQVEGRAVVGELTNQYLDILPSLVTTWGQWKTLHPETWVLARPTNRIDYARDIFGGYVNRVNDRQFVFPVDPDAAQDDRLMAGDNVLVIEVGTVARAYPIAQFGNAAITDSIGDQPILVLSLDDGVSAAAFDPTLPDGTNVNLRFESGLWRDDTTGSQFDFTGRAVSGEVAGTQLQPLPIRYTFWFAAVASLPHIEVYQHGQ